MTLQFSKMIMRKHAKERAAQFCPIDQRRVAEFVEQDNVIFGDEGRDGAERSRVSTAEAKRRVGSFPLRNRALQTHMWRLRAANQSRRSSTDAEFLDRRECCFA